MNERKYYTHLRVVHLPLNSNLISEFIPYTASWATALHSLLLLPASQKCTKFFRFQC